VLEDGLYGEFHAFKHGEPHDSRLLEKLLHLYKPPHITNVDQLNRLQIDDAPLKSQLARSGLISQSIEELAQKNDLQNCSFERKQYLSACQHL
jgi:hypothetical protein